MPVSRWFSGGRPGLRDRLVKALQQARDDDLEGAIETISERFPQAMVELQSLRAADVGWLRLCAWVAYRAGDMAPAAEAAARAIAAEEDARTWNLLGRLRVWLAHADAGAAFERAASLAPRAYVMPYRIGRQRFVRMAEAALATVPDQFQQQLSNTMIVVDDLPSLESVQEGEDPDLLGVYEGATVLEHGLPERIVLYQRNHENVSASVRELEQEVVETMRHEIGHHFGMAEDELPY